VIHLPFAYVCEGMGSTPPSNTGRATLPLVGAVNLLPLVLIAVLAGVAATLIGCGGGTDSTSSGSSSSADSGATAAGTSQSADALTISDYEYAPADITVPAGTTIEITNKDSTPHTVTSKESGVFESGSIDKGKPGEVKLEQPGTFAYYCVFHPFMKGTITVE
jgi:plastocyanin